MSGIIVAPATAPFAGHRAVIRLSGSGSHELASQLAETEGSGRVRKASFKSPFLGLQGWMYVFRRGASYTTEEMVEIHIPGNPLLVTRLVNRCKSLGARDAARGEFTLRAVRGGRLTLQQALAVMRLVESRTQEERKEALQSLTGSGQDALALLRGRVMEGLVHLENDLDFDDLDVGLLPPNFAQTLIREIARLWESLKRHQNSMGLPRVVLKGPCNAGKSTLFNALGGRALVSDEAGTTRDYLETEVTWAGQRFVLVDTPGLTGPDSSIDMRAMALAREQWDRADLVVQVSRAGDGGGNPVDWFTCADLGRNPHGDRQLSARSGMGLDAFKDWIVARLWGQSASNYLSVSHCARIGEIIDRLDSDAAEPAALAASLRELAQALNPLGEALNPEEILNRLFSSFCVGK